jgi:hypothetical protein
MLVLSTLVAWQGEQAMLMSPDTSKALLTM